MTPALRRLAPQRHRIGAALLAAGAALVVAACSSGSAPAWTFPAQATLEPVMVQAVTPPPFGSRETAYNPPVAAPPLRLTDQDGQPFDLASLRGTPVFVYFGYTHCPDVCPTTLADLRAGIRQAGLPAKVVFVTVDPDRDDAAAMRQYTGYYDAGFIGLTGTAAEIAQAAADWGVSYRKEPADASGAYAMSHSTETYLLDAQGRLRHHLFFGSPPELIADRLAEVTRDR